MRRWLILLSALVLSLQFGWSVAAAYCQHESSDQQQSQHFGHHFHLHKGDKDGSPAGKLIPDTDCCVCHAAGHGVVASYGDTATFAMTPSAAKPGASPPFTSVPARAPDRPQWLRLV